MPSILNLFSEDKPKDKYYLKRLYSLPYGCDYPLYVQTIYDYGYEGHDDLAFIRNNPYIDAVFNGCESFTHPLIDMAVSFPWKLFISGYDWEFYRGSLYSLAPLFGAAKFYAAFTATYNVWFGDKNADEANLMDAAYRESLLAKLYTGNKAFIAKMLSTPVFINDNYLHYNNMFPYKGSGNPNAADKGGKIYKALLGIAKAVVQDRLPDNDTSVAYAKAYPHLYRAFVGAHQLSIELWNEKPKDKLKNPLPLDIGAFAAYSLYDHAFKMLTSPEFLNDKENFAAYADSYFKYENETVADGIYFLYNYAPDMDDKLEICADKRFHYVKQPKRYGCTTGVGWYITLAYHRHGK